MTKHIAKKRMTFSLSQASAEFLRTFRKEEQAPSMSASVEKLIEKFKRARELAELNASVAAHYNSLPQERMEEDAAWGEMGALGLTAMETEAVENNNELVHA